MNELTFVYGTITLMVAAFATQVLTKKFDPFAPTWLFMVGYAQVYVIQALSYHDWALGVRGVDVVTAANFRAFWALAWFLGVYYFGPGAALARGLPRPPVRWSSGVVTVVSPILVVWGILCAGLVLRSPGDDSQPSAEASLLLSFPLVMLIGGVLLIVTGRQPWKPQPVLTAAGVSVVALYMLIWIFNGKRSHSLVAVLVGVCSFYVPRLKRPTFPVLVMTALAGAMAVGISIGWRYHSARTNSHGSMAKFVDFVANFDPEIILESVNMKEKQGAKVSYETEELGGFLLMMDTVPMKADYDYGENYLRVFSTFIPRLIWKDKPIYGRDQWVAAWVAGSELKRDTKFTGPAIGIMGATQLNGGSLATFIVMGTLGLALRTGYEYYRHHASLPWAQVWWSLIYYNAWLMTVGDDPLTWFYYNYGFTTLPPMLALWCYNKFWSGD